MEEEQNKNKRNKKKKKVSWDKTEETKLIRGELGQKIEQECREMARTNLSMRVHLFCEEYIHWRSQFQNTESLVEWYDYVRHNPGAEGDARIVGMRALHFALDQLEPDLAQAESTRVRLELLKQEQEDFELQKQVFQSHVSGFSSAMEEVLKIITRIDQMVQDQKGRLMDQLLLDQEGVAKVIEENITHEMKQWGEVLRTLVEKGIPDGKTPFRLNYKDTKRLCGFRNRNNFKLWPHSFWERT